MAATVGVNIDGVGACDGVASGLFEAVTDAVLVGFGAVAFDLG